MAVVKRIVPSQAASGAETFSDGLVGNQRTTGNLVNENFTIDKIIPERDAKNFKTSPFSDFLTLDTLKEETDLTVSEDGTGTVIKNEKIKFRGSINDAGKSLFGSLKLRLEVSVNDIISRFPGGILIDQTSPLRIDTYTLKNIVYNTTLKNTTFYVNKNILYNPLDLVIEQPKSNTLPTSSNPLRNFYSSYRKYVIEYSGQTYPIISYSEPNSDNEIKLVVKGNPFGTNTDLSVDLLIKPKDSIIEEFFNNLDEIQTLLIDRTSSPIYTANFKVPTTSLDGSKNEISNFEVTWPVSKDGWNIQIVGLGFEEYIERLSSIGDEIDDYKSNLVVRFLTAPQLFEFDTEDQKVQSLFQLYGQSFDKVKKYIDNIAYMRNVSYDGINNVPDLLLKNLANTLGLDTVNLFDEKLLDETLYTRTDAQYAGLTIGHTLIDAEHEFYRRMLVNLAHIYKSKGTRASLEFFLKFLGAPEPMIKIDEYIYEVASVPKVQNVLNNDVYDLINGLKINTQVTGVTETSTGITYNAASITGNTNLSSSEYPIDENNLPRKVTNLTEDIFFQKGAGWYDLTLNHRSPMIVDEANSILTGYTKTIKTKPKDFTYGEDYFDHFRNLQGLDYGFELDSKVDNLQINNSSENDSKLILNRKNLNVNLSAARAVDYDIWRQSRNLGINFGSATLYSQTGYTFAEYLDTVLTQTIKDSNIIKYKNNYIVLQDIYNDYMNLINNTGYTPYDFISANEFIERMSPYWTSVIDQFVPSTTLWTGGNLIENNIFQRSKYKYRKPCQIYEFLEPAFPTPATGNKHFQEEIFQFQFYFSQDDDFNYDGYLQFFPIFEIDGITYSGSTDPVFIPIPLNSEYGYNAPYMGISTNNTNIISFENVPTPTPTLTKKSLFDPENYEAMQGYSGTTYALLSGSTTTNFSAKLYKGDGTNDFEPDYNKLRTLWREAIIDTVNYINFYSGYTMDGINGFKGETYSGGTNTITRLPRISCEFVKFTGGTDNDEYVKFKSYKYGPHSCTVDKSFEFKVGYGAIAIDPTPTPTPTKTPTQTPTPTQTSTQTPTPTQTQTPTQTPTPTLPCLIVGSATYSDTFFGTKTPTPTPTYTPTQTPTPTIPLPGCGSVISKTYSGSDLHNYGEYDLDLTAATNGSTISFICTANDRPNNITIKKGTGTEATTGWFGNSSGYDSGDYWYPTEGTGPKTLTITYDNTQSYSINVLTAPSSTIDDNWEVNIQCAAAVSQTPTKTPTPTPTYTPTSTPVFYWYELTLCDDGTTKCWSVPISGGADHVGKLYWSGSGSYYVMGTYINTTDADPGNGACSGKVDGTIMSRDNTCESVGHAPPPPPNPELSMNNLTSDCNNTGTYKGKVYASWSDGTPPYQIRAGFVGSGFSSWYSVGSDTSKTISDPSSPYDGSTGIRNTTGGSDIFAVEVKDSADITKGKSISINCTYTNTTPNWTYQYQTCDGCVTYNVEKDLNGDSPTGGHYRYNGTDVGTSAPSNGACSTSPVIGSQVGTYYRCVVDTGYGQGHVYSVPVYGNSNSCAGTKFYYTDIYGENGTWYDDNPSNSESTVTSAYWVTEGYSCVDNKKVYLQRDWGACSSTFGQTQNIPSNDFCASYSYYGTFTMTCEDIDTGGTTYNVYTDGTYWRYDGDTGNLVSGTLYNVDSYRATFFDNGSLTGTASESCN